MQENMDTIQSLTYNDLGQVTQLIRVGHQADMTYQYDLLQGVVSGIASTKGLIPIR